MKKIVLFIMFIFSFFITENIFAYDVYYIKNYQSVYKKSSEDTWTWVLFSYNWINRIWLNFDPTWNYIIYSYGSNPRDIYRKQLNDWIVSNIWTQLTSWILTSDAVYTPDWQYIIYRNQTDWNKCYKKSAFTLSNWSAITNVSCYSPILSPRGNYLYYSNWADSKKIYIKSPDDTLTWTSINWVSSDYLTISPDWNNLVYTNLSDSSKLYKKNTYDTNNWTWITTVSNSYYPSYSSDWNYIIYSNVWDWKLYKKTSSWVDNWSAISNWLGWNYYSRSYIQFASCDDWIQNQDETSVDFWWVCWSTTQVCYTGVTNTGSITHSNQWTWPVYTNIFSTWWIFHIIWWTADMYYEWSWSSFFSPKQFFNQKYNNVSITWTWWVWTLGFPLFYLIDTDTISQDLWFSPKLRIYTDNNWFTGNVYTSWTTIEWPWVPAVGSNYFSSFKVNWIESAGYATNFTYCYYPLMQDFDWNEYTWNQVCNNNSNLINTWIDLPYFTKQVTIYFDWNKTYLLDWYSDTYDTVFMSYWTKNFDYTQICHTYSDEFLSWATSLAWDVKNVWEAMQKIAQQKAVENKYKFSNPLLDWFINSVNDFANSIWLWDIVSFLSIYVPSSPVLNIDIPKITLSSWKVNLTQINVVLKPITATGWLTSPLGTWFSSSDCSWNSCKILWWTNYKMSTILWIVSMVIYLVFFLWMISIIFMWFHFISWASQNIIESLFWWSWSIENVSWNIFSFFSWVAWWLYLAKMMITISTILVFIIPLVNVAKQWLLVWLSMVLMSFAGSTGWENFQLYTNFFINSVLVWVIIYWLYFVLTKFWKL